MGYVPPGGGLYPLNKTKIFFLLTILKIFIFLSINLLATVFGDPHIYTFDNQAFTFNGLGEYVLVRANSPKVKLDVQGRFEQVGLNVNIVFTLNYFLRLTTARMELFWRLISLPWRPKITFQLQLR